MTITDVGDAARAIHDGICPKQERDPHDYRTCLLTPRPDPLRRALEVLAARPRDARGARVALHNGVCMSGCVGEQAVDHASTQTAAVRVLRKWLATR